MVHQFDRIIIGSGGGTKLRPAASHGEKIAIIEKDVLGGTCLNRGCIPSKMLIYPSEIIEKVRHVEKFGIDVQLDMSVRWEDLVGRTTQTVAHDADAIKHGYEKNPNITFFHGHARFVDHKVLEVDGRRITAPAIYIATGARPLIPSIPGLASTPFWTSTEALRSTHQPKSLIVIGGGYIAMELGTFYAQVGTEVTFVARSGLLGGEDKDIRHHFEEYFTSRHRVHMFTDTTKVSYDNSQFTVTIRTKDGEERTLHADALLVATGVVPNSDDLGLEHTHVTKNARGFIEVDEHMETKEPGIYALGDVVGKYLFRHNVNFEGEYLFDQHVRGNDKQPIVYPPMPHAVFTTPQIAGVGATEDELLLQGLRPDEEYLVVVQQYKDSAMGMAMLPDMGFVKLLVDRKKRTLLGAHIIGEKAADLIHILILGMTMDLTVEDYLRMIYIHPALSEVVRNALRKAKDTM